MKKLLFSAVDMNIGGIENALLTLLNFLANNEYEITLVLEKRQGVFLNDLNNKIDVIAYAPSEFKIKIIRKMINMVKRIAFILKYKNKFDFSASFATYSKMGSFVARMASRNSVLWGHADYLELYGHDEQKVKEFFEGVHYEDFKKIVFVSNKACDSFLKVYPEMKSKVEFCNNIIDYEKVEKLSKEEIEYNKTKYTFINVGRHDEKQKKLTRIIEAARMLKEETSDFEILFLRIWNRYISLQ